MTPAQIAAALLFFGKNQEPLLRFLNTIPVVEKDGQFQKDFSVLADLSEVSRWQETEEIINLLFTDPDELKNFFYVASEMGRGNFTIETLLSEDLVALVIHNPTEIFGMISQVADALNPDNFSEKQVFTQRYMAGKAQSHIADITKDAEKPDNSAVSLGHAVDVLSNLNDIGMLDVVVTDAKRSGLLEVKGGQIFTDTSYSNIAKMALSMRHNIIGSVLGAAFNLPARVLGSYSPIGKIDNADIVDTVQSVRTFISYFGNHRDPLEAVEILLHDVRGLSPERLEKLEKIITDLPDSEIGNILNELREHQVLSMQTRAQSFDRELLGTLDAISMSATHHRHHQATSSQMRRVTGSSSQSQAPGELSFSPESVAQLIAENAINFSEAKRKMQSGNAGSLMGMGSIIPGLVGNIEGVQHLIKGGLELIAAESPAIIARQMISKEVLGYLAAQPAAIQTLLEMTELDTTPRADVSSHRRLGMLVEYIGRHPEEANSILRKDFITSGVKLSAGLTKKLDIDIVPFIRDISRLRSGKIGLGDFLVPEVLAKVQENPAAFAAILEYAGVHELIEANIQNSLQGQSRLHQQVAETTEQLVEMVYADKKGKHTGVLEIPFKQEGSGFVPLAFVDFRQRMADYEPGKKAQKKATHVESLLSLEPMYLQKIHAGDLSRINLRHMNFGMPLCFSMRGIDFNHAVLESCSFRGADIRGCNFTNTVFIAGRGERKDIFRDALIDRETLNTLLPEVKAGRIDLTGAIFIGDMRGIEIHTIPEEMQIRTTETSYVASEKKSSSSSKSKRNEKLDVEKLYDEFGIRRIESVVIHPLRSLTFAQYHDHLDIIIDKAIQYACITNPVLARDKEAQQDIKDGFKYAFANNVADVVDQMAHSPDAKVRIAPEDKDRFMIYVADRLLLSETLSDDFARLIGPWIASAEQFDSGYRELLGKYTAYYAQEFVAQESLLQKNKSAAEKSARVTQIASYVQTGVDASIADVRLHYDKNAVRSDWDHTVLPDVSFSGKQQVCKTLTRYLETRIEAQPTVAMDEGTKLEQLKNQKTQDFLMRALNKGQVLRGANGKQISFTSSLAENIWFRMQVRVEGERETPEKILLAVDDSTRSISADIRSTFKERRWREPTSISTATNTMQSILAASPLYQQPDFRFAADEALERFNEVLRQNGGRDENKPLEKAVLRNALKAFRIRFNSCYELATSAEHTWGELKVAAQMEAIKYRDELGKLVNGVVSDVAKPARFRPGEGQFRTELQSHMIDLLEPHFDAVYGIKPGKETTPEAGFSRHLLNRLPEFSTQCAKNILDIRSNVYIVPKIGDELKHAVNEQFQQLYEAEKKQYNTLRTCYSLADQAVNQFMKTLQQTDPEAAASIRKVDIRVMKYAVATSIVQNIANDEQNLAMVQKFSKGFCGKLAQELDNMALGFLVESDQRLRVNRKILFAAGNAVHEALGEVVNRQKHAQAIDALASLNISTRVREFLETPGIDIPVPRPESQTSSLRRTSSVSISTQEGMLLQEFQDRTGWRWEAGNTVFRHRITDNTDIDLLKESLSELGIPKRKISVVNNNVDGYYVTVSKADIEAAVTLPEAPQVNRQALRQLGGALQYIISEKDLRQPHITQMVSEIFWGNDSTTGKSHVQKMVRDEVLTRLAVHGFGDRHIGEWKQLTPEEYGSAVEKITNMMEKKSFDIRTKRNVQEVINQLSDIIKDSLQTTKGITPNRVISERNHDMGM